MLLGAAASGVGLWLSSGERDTSDEGLPLVYDVDQINTFWDSRPHTALWRAAEIASTVVPFALRVLVDRKMGRFSDERHCEARAVEFRELLTRLGPTFIKFGQMLSIRPDVLPSTLLYELQKLCDAVPSFPTSIALATIRSELQAEAADLFDDLGPDTAPIAAASLGQVYRCRLRTSGEWVAVKVQRPDMLRAVSLDIYLLRKYMHAVEYTKRSLTMLGLMNQPVAYDVQLLDTFAGASYKELDYREEARSQKLFRSELLARMPDTVHVPAVIEEGTSRKVLTTQWVEGVQLARSPPEVINKLVKVGVECFLAQLLDMGYFHSDPHPGNLLVTTDGKLALIDFGLCAEVSRPDTQNMTTAIVHLMQGDVSELLQDAIGLGFLPADVDTEMLLPVLQKVFDQGQLAAVEEGSLSSRFKATAQRRKQFSAISKDLNQIFFDFPFQVPEYFALITRALIVLEGIAVTGDPKFDIFRAAYPYASQRAVQLFGADQMATILSEVKYHPQLIRASATGFRHTYHLLRHFVLHMKHTLSAYWTALRGC